MAQGSQGLTNGAGSTVLAHWLVNTAIGQGGTLEIGPIQECAADFGAGQIGFAQVSAAQIGATEVGFD